MKLPSSVNILLLGSGGRECAFAYKIAQSSHLGKLFIAPGNAGTAQYGTNVDLSPIDFALIGQFALNNHINLVVVGSEEPLVRGIRDFFLENDQIRHIPVLGPSKAAAALEGSKDFSKMFMNRHNIPTARYKTITADNLDEGFEFLESLKPPYVLKADGLAAGKGVLIMDDLQQAKDELRAMIKDKKFGAASTKVVIEEFLDGIEVSVFVATDGHSYKMLPQAKDYKRIGEGHTGPNTGGMGAVSPVPFADKQFMDKVLKRIIEPTINGIKNEQLDYKGFIFFGLINCAGDPYVIEYNVRMGDPETQAVFTRIDSDIIDLFDGVIHGTLNQKVVEINPKTAVTVVITSGGYPDQYQKGFTIEGLENANQIKDVIVFHSGTECKKNQIVTAGGRVLAVTAIGNDIQEAAKKAYKAAEQISFEKKYLRRDIGQDLEPIS